MENDFNKSLEFVLLHEGGYVNDPHDPGGETKYGISKRAHPDMDIRNLTKEQAGVIYYNDYWRKSNAYKYPWPVCLIMFDTAVNMGVSRGNKFFDEVGPDAKKLIACRRNHYLRIVAKKPLMKKYLKGWMNRIKDLEVYASIHV